MFWYISEILAWDWLNKEETLLGLCMRGWNLVQLTQKPHTNNFLLHEATARFPNAVTWFGFWHLIGNVNFKFPPMLLQLWRKSSLFHLLDIKCWYWGIWWGTSMLQVSHVIVITFTPFSQCSCTDWGQEWPIRLWLTVGFSQTWDAK